MLKSFAMASILLVMTLVVSGQNKSVQFMDLKALQRTDPKPVVVLIMTDWCKYCHAMQNIMLKNAKVAPLLQNNFYSIFLNAEEKTDISFAGRTFKFKQGANELARELATVEGQVSFPTLCILNAKNEIIYQHDGFLSAEAMQYTLEKISKLGD